MLAVFSAWVAFAAQPVTPVPVDGKTWPDELIPVVVSAVQTCVDAEPWEGTFELSRFANELTVRTTPWGGPKDCVTAKLGNLADDLDRDSETHVAVEVDPAWREGVFVDDAPNEELRAKIVDRFAMCVRGRPLHTRFPILVEGRKSYEDVAVYMSVDSGSPYTELSDEIDSCAARGQWTLRGWTAGKKVAAIVRLETADAPTPPEVVIDPYKTVPDDMLRELTRVAHACIALSPGSAGSFGYAVSTKSSTLVNAGDGVSETLKECLMQSSVFGLRRGDDFYQIQLTL